MSLSIVQHAFIYLAASACQLVMAWILVKLQYGVVARRGYNYMV